jgi:broad specificity phosphatase PhoE
MKILLIRHGESQGNVDQGIHRIIPDHEIALSSRGKEQALIAGEIIKSFYEKTYGDLLKEVPTNEQPQDAMKLFETAMKIMAGKGRPKIRLWQSPYRRTRETAEIIEKSLNGILFDKREHVLLCEQQFGLFDGIDDDLQKQKFPEEFSCFQHTKQYNGKFWARYPMGESAFDTACRLHQAFGTFHRDAENHGINDIIVVCHGTVLRLFTMMWLHKTYEWFAKEKNPGNCAIRLIDDNTDFGYIYGA